MRRKKLPSRKRQALWRVLLTPITVPHLPWQL